MFQMMKLAETLCDPEEESILTATSMGSGSEHNAGFSIRAHDIPVLNFTKLGELPVIVYVDGKVEIENKIHVLQNLDKLK